MRCRSRDLEMKRIFWMTEEVKVKRIRVLTFKLSRMLSETKRIQKASLAVLALLLRVSLQSTQTYPLHYSAYQIPKVSGIWYEI